MEKGYGFGAEGDWKTAAMVRLMKIMTAGVKDAKGTSFMEDYTYNLVPGKEGILAVTHAGGMPDHRRRTDRHQGMPAFHG